MWNTEAGRVGLVTSIFLPSASPCPLPCALPASILLLYLCPCGSCLLHAVLLVQQFLHGYVSPWGERGSCAHPTLWSVHGDELSSAPASTEGGVHNSGSCSGWEVQVRIAFSVLAKFFWGPSKGKQIPDHTKTPWSSWSSQVFCDLSCSISSQKILAQCYLIWK